MVDTQSYLEAESVVPWANATMSNILNGTTPNYLPTPSPDSGPATYVGFLAAILAIFVYGTMFAPVKKFETGDGMFFQWVLCISIWTTGLFVQVVRNSPKFYPICMLGGALWTTGNICAVPIVKTIGLGLGMCIWGMTNLLSGWATGRFGLFDTHKDKISNLILNDIGVVLAVSSAVIFSLVKNNLGDIEDGEIEIITEDSPLLKEKKMSISINPRDLVFKEVSFIDSLSPTSKRILGIGLSFGSGFMYGQLFTPAKYLQDHGHSSDGLDYVFSTFCGIILSSTVYFLLYAIAMRNKPKIYPNVILPGCISGTMWGVATSCWFVANKVLSQSVAFPMITTGPGVVASLMGVFIFKEITALPNDNILEFFKLERVADDETGDDKDEIMSCTENIGTKEKIPVIFGKKNLLVLCLGMAVTISGAIFAGLSF